MRRVLLIVIVCLLGWNVGSAQDFPYPSIPNELRTPEERGTYLLAHYWDNFDFSDTTLLHKPEITEQGFSNFIDLLPRIGSDSIVVLNGVKAFAEKAFAVNTPTATRTYFAKLTEHYLYNPNSPMRSDDLFLLFLPHLCSAEWDEATLTRYRYMMVNLQKNQTGSMATDFTYVNRQGQKGSLYETDGELLLLYFYDPDCEDCHRTTELMRKDSLFSANPRLQVLAIYPYENISEWRSQIQPFPSEWIDAYSPKGEIETEGLYFLRATPTLYLLDSHKRVLLKDASVERIRYFLQESQR